MHRCLAAQALGRIANPAAVDDLVEALVDQDEDVRTDAAKALCRFSDPRAARQLLDNLVGDPCIDVKLNAIEALARMRHRELAPWLRRLLKGRDEGIAWDEEEFHADGWDGWVDIQTKAVEALAQLGIEDAVADIVEALDDELGQDLTEVGFKALARLGRPGVEAVARYLDDASERRRRRAAAVLAGVGTEAADDAVARALGDSSVNVRLAAARALAARNPADRRLVAFLRDARPEVRAEAVRFCGRRHPDRLAALLDDEAPAVRRAVVEVVAGAPSLLPAARVVERTRSWLRGDDAALAAAAGVALAAVDAAAAVDELAEQLVNTGRPIEVRLGAVKGLARIGGETAAPVLAGIVGDDHRQLRIEAMAALAGLAATDAEWPNAAADALLAALRGELVAQEAPETEPDDGRVASAGDDGTSEAVAAEAEAAFPTSTLGAILGERPRSTPDPSEDGTELTQEDMEFLALSMRAPRTKRVPVAPTVAPHRDVRRVAARLLGDLAHDDVARALAECLDDGDADVRRAAADSLARVADRLKSFPAPVVGALLETLSDGDRDMRLSIVRALGAAGDRAAVTAVTGRLADDDGFVRVEAVRALSRLRAGAREIEALLGDAEPEVRAAAARAVADAGDARATELLVDFAFAFGGHHRREAGRLLRGLDTAAASVRLLDVLDDRRHKRSWRIAIEALDELHRRDRAAADEAMAQT